MSWYPKYVYNIKEDVTRQNMNEYDRKKEMWWNKAEELYPDYHKLPIRKRLELRDEINNAVGFSCP